MLADLGRTAMSRPDHRAQSPERQEMIDHLRLLVQAIDARTGHLEHKGEAEIARDAAALRQKALERIAELEGADT
jgi:hypothetical protein